MTEKLTFLDYLMLLSTQALFGLGNTPNPETGKTEINLPLAQHSIDVMGMLEEKTRGNLSDEETHVLQQTLAQLRLSYVEVWKREAAAGASEEDAPAPEGA